MGEDLDGPFGDLYALTHPWESAGGASAQEEASLRRLLFRLLDEPGANRHVLQRLAFEDPLAPSLDVDDAELVTRLVRHVESGRLMLRHQPVAGGGLARGTGGLGALGDAANALAGDSGSGDSADEVKVKGWRLECEHHVSKGRDLHEKGARIEVVPDRGETRERVIVHWRDDWQPGMPGQLDVKSPGQPDSSAPQSGASGMYTTYELDAPYLGDVDIKNFLLPSFWSAFKETTTHTFRPGPTSIQVVVYNPRQFKFEFKLPPMAGFKDGSKYEARGAQQIRSLAKTGAIKKTVETEDAYWTPSKLSLDVTRTSSDPGPEFEPSSSSMALADTISLKRDGALVPDLDLLTLVGSVLKYADTLRGIVKMVRDYAPQVGWYIDWNLQLMQGGAAVEWYWKEHTDHRVFQYIDFKVSLTLFSLTFEIGIGVSACSFKLQIFASLGGELGLEAGACRDSPEGGPGVQLPGIKGKIAGALGARAEAGYFFKFNAKGETAIEAEAQIGINQRGKMFTGDLRARWTGINCTATFSAGLLGISWNETKSLTLVPAGPWWGVSFPADEPYRPPTMSQAAISSVIQGVLRSGWDLLVYDDAGRVRYSHKAVGDFIAGYVARHPTFDQTPKNVDLLANAIREDLDRLGVRSWERDWVALSALRRYCAGGLQTWLEAAASPTKKLAAANGG